MSASAGSQLTLAWRGMMLDASLWWAISQFRHLCVDTYRYLGAHFGYNPDKNKIVAELKTMLSLTSSVPNRPQQRL